MSAKLQPVRGTHDILPEEFEKFHAVVTRARELATLYGFREMATPIFEPTEVFSRSMGETSDVVAKEMFTFDTRGGESVTLRPEFTAGTVRAFLSNGMQQHLPLKLFSTGPLFRYERPQKGRQRQFHQVNFEWLGDGSAEADVEMITLAGHLLYSLSGSQGAKLKINTLGDQESRVRYRETLVNYLTPYAAELSEDSQRRLITNPLRILDSKSEQDKKIIQEAPSIIKSLSKTSKERFDKVFYLLKQKVLPLFQEAELDFALVRGLDYYTDTVFEFVAETGELGAQNTVLAGGRYDGLVKDMGGNQTPAIGFAAGVERLLLLTPATSWQKKNTIKIMLLPFEQIPPEVVLSITMVLRGEIEEKLQKSDKKWCSSVEILWQGSPKKRMEKSAQAEANYVIIFAPEEYARGAFIIRNMRTREQQEVKIDDVVKQRVGSIQLLNIST